MSVLAVLALLFSACGGGAGSSSNGNAADSVADANEPVSKKEIRMALVDGWAEGVAMTHLATEVLKAQGYEVTIQRAAVDLVFASLANGDLDVFMDVWLPVTHGSKVEKFSGQIEQLGINYDAARIGLVVPKYVEIDRIEDLNAHAEKFDGKIIGVESGAGITARTNDVIKEYGLQLEQVNSSSIAMLAELKKSIDESRWVVVAGWIPHWKFGRYELKFLEDPKGVYGAAETLETYCRKGFREADPMAAKFFANFHMDEAQMADLLLKMEGEGEKTDIARQWMEEHKELVDSWLR
ncbi:MAG: glycine/betaine ABC transporter [Bacteroidia bacterium]|nr:MAG: glycine/betaine ABC transporter [Bacteroidia bacterium]